MLFYDSLSAYIQGEMEKLRCLQGIILPETGIISKVLAPNQDQDKKSNPTRYSLTQEVDFLKIDSLGIHGDRHRRSHRSSTVRERAIFPKGTIIREHRHVFAVSLYDCKVLSENLGVEVTPELLGVNIVIETENNQDYSLSALPQGTYLQIYSSTKEKQIAVLEKRVTQQGCGVTGNAIRLYYKREADITQKFIEVSKSNRGIVCSVESPVEHIARIEAGQRVCFRFPTGLVT